MDQVLNVLCSLKKDPKADTPSSAAGTVAAPWFKSRDHAEDFLYFLQATGTVRVLGELSHRVVFLDLQVMVKAIRALMSHNLCFDRDEELPAKTQQAMRTFLKAQVGEGTEVAGPRQKMYKQMYK